MSSATTGIAGMLLPPCVETNNMLTCARHARIGMCMRRAQALGRHPRNTRNTRNGHDSRVLRGHSGEAVAGAHYRASPRTFFDLT